MAGGPRPSMSSGGPRPSGVGAGGSRPSGFGAGGARPGSGKPTKKKEEGSHLGPIPLLHFGHLPAGSINPLSWTVAAGEKLGIVPHKYAGIGYVPAQAVQTAVLHPALTTKQFGQGFVGAAELAYAARKAKLTDLRHDPVGKAAAAKKFFEMFVESTRQNYKNQYGPDWRKYSQENPLGNLLDVLTVLGVGVRGASLVGAAGRLDPESSRIATMLAHPRATVRESGNFPPRVLEHTTPEGTKISSTQPSSRSPLRAGIQHEILDPLSRRFPTARGFGAMPRITRANASQIKRAVDRSLASIPGVDAVGRLSKGEAARIFWGSQLADYSAPELRRLRDALANHYDEPLPGDDAAFGEHLHRAKQAGFGPDQLAGIDAAIAHAEKHPDIVPGSKMDHAIRALEHSTRVTEETILDADGFSGITNEIEHTLRAIDRVESPEALATLEKKLSALETQRDMMREQHMDMFDKRRNLVHDFVNAQTRVDSPIRTAWRAQLLKQWKDPAKADAAIAATDRMAVRFRPHDPASWWADKYGMPTDESAAAFVRRVESLPPEERNHLYQYSLGQFGADKAHLYTSPLHDAIERMPGKQMTAGQLRKYLPKEGVSHEEMLHGGVHDILESRSLGEMVTKAELEAAVNSPENMLNLVEHHWESGSGEPPPLIGMPEFRGINSRSHTGNEYHHLAVGTDPEGVVHYGEQLAGDKPGSGWLHTVTRRRGPGKLNVIAHIRYHIFTDPYDGLKKMLIEEVQSDWASDAQKEAKALGTLKGSPRSAYGNRLTSEEQAMLAQAQAEEAYLKNELAALESEGGPDHEIEAIQEQLHSVQSDIENLTDVGRLAPSPLGRERYLRTLAHRAAQEAHRHGVDQIVLADAPTQTVRNLRKENAGLVPWDAPNPEIAAHVRAISNPDSAFNSIYERDFPKMLKEATGEEGAHAADAYTGQFRNAYNPRLQSEEGAMAGTVFSLGDKAAANAEKTRALYQQAKRGKLPNGATEFLQDGKSAVRMFKNGDISTWLHELSHVALSDLPEGDIATLEKHFGNGTPVAKWTNDMHEEYARSFERYMATGKAPTRSLEDTFAKIAEWMSALWNVAKEDIPEIHPEVRTVFDSMFAGHGKPTVFMPHRPMSVSLSGARTTRGMPRNQRDIGDQVLSEAASFRRNRLSLLRSGTLNADPRAALEHANRVMMLARANQMREAVMELSRPLRPGEIPDLRTQYVVKRAGRGVDKPLYDALENADNVDDVRERVAAHVEDNITNKREVLEKWEQELANDPSAALSVVDKQTVDHLFKNVTGQPLGAATKPVNTGTKIMDALLDSVRGMLLYANPGFYVANLAGNSIMAMMADPRAARYLPWAMKEAIKGMGRGEKTDPLWHRIAVEMGRGPTSGGLSERRPSLLGQGGRKVGGGIFDKEAIAERRARIGYTLAHEKSALPGRGASNVSHFWGMAGRNSGRIIDDSFRVAVWRQVAHKLGYTSDKAIHKLLDDAVEASRHKMLEANSKPLRDLNSIRDEAEQLMLDFDSMTPFEKKYMTRLFFLYPFTKAAAKYPFMYAGERPVSAGLLGQAGLQSSLYSNQVLGPPDPNLPKWMDGYARTPWGYLPVSSVSSFQPLAQLFASGANIGGEGQLGVARPIEYANPLLQLVIDMARQQNKFGKSQPMLKTLGQEFPAPAYVKQMFGKEPGKIYADRDFLHTLERAFRMPFQIDPSVAAQEKARGG